jgi:hypothetical protein
MRLLHSSIRRVDYTTRHRSKICAANVPVGRSGAPWDDFRFNYFRGKDSETAAHELVAWAPPQGIKVEFAVRREDRLDVIYVFLAAR